MKTAEYLEAIKAMHGIKSDYKLAKLLNISTQQMSHYATGKRLPGPLLCFRIAELLNDQPSAVIADIELERAERGEREADASAWRKVVGKISGTALATILVMSAIFGGSNADAASGGTATRYFDANFYTSYEVLRMVARALHWLKLARKRCASWLSAGGVGVALCPA